MADRDERADLASGWKLGERGLREKEVKRQWYSAIVQGLIAAVAIFGVFVAGLAALKAGDAVDVAKRGIQSNTDQNRLSAAVDAIGGSEPTQRVAGLTLLRRLSTQRLENATVGDPSASERSDVRSLYRATVDILATYLKTASDSPQELNIDSQLPTDAAYAASDLKLWLKEKDAYRQLAKGGSEFSIVDLKQWFKRKGTLRTLTKDRSDVLPNVDLENAPLFRVSWRDIDFSWLGARYLPGVDLRQANLINSQWGSSTMRGAQLECTHFDSAQLRESSFQRADLRDASLKMADLRRAEFGGEDPAEGANLERADFTLADLRGAVFRNANLSGADLTSAKLRGADLRNANLSDADLYGADLVGADLTGADLTGARVDRSRRSDGLLDDLRNPAEPERGYGNKEHPECPPTRH